MTPLRKKQLAFLAVSALSEDKTCIVWPFSKNTKTHYGYLSDDSYAHRRALEIRIGRPLIKGEEAMHNCDNPSCVNGSHLEAGTHAKNLRDAFKRGRLPQPTPTIGVDHHSAKLNPDKVREIRAQYASGVSSAALAKRFGVSWTAIKYVLSGRNWKHVI